MLSHLHFMMVTCCLVALSWGHPDPPEAGRSHPHIGTESVEDYVEQLHSDKDSVFLNLRKLDSVTRFDTIDPLSVF